MSSAATVELREYERTEVDGLSRDDVAALCAAAPSLRADHLGGGRWRLTPGHHVGFLRVGALHVHIRPKVAVGNLLFLLSHAADRLAWRDEQVPTAADAHLVDAMAHLLAESALRATRRGVLQGYRRRDEALNVVRGRWRVDDQVRRHQGRFLPAEVGYDDYTEDITENRLVATALRLVRGGVVDVATRRRVGRALARFDGQVGSLPRPLWTDPPVVAWHRLNAHYRGAVELARLVLAGSAVTHRAGSAAAHGVLVDMNDLFERFVRRALDDLLPGDVRKPRPRRHALDLEGLIGLEPDVVWSPAAEPVVVADAKYKVLDTRAAREDLFQLLAYCTALDVPSGLLIYATPGGPTRHRLVDERTTISVIGVDLAGSPADISAGVEAVADEARALAASSGIPGRARRPEGQRRARVR